MLRYLNLSRCFFGSILALKHLVKVVTILAEANLEELCMTMCGLGDGGALAVIGALPAGCKLQTLHLSYNTLTDTTAAALTHALPRLDRLKDVSLVCKGAMRDTERGRALIAAAKRAGVRLLTTGHWIFRDFA